MNYPIKILLLISLLLSQNCTSFLVEEDENLKNIEHILVEKINQIRIQNNLRPLKENQLLIYLARDHCKEMIKSEKISHKSYKIRSQVISNLIYQNRYGENVAYALSLKYMPNKVITSWLNSETHAANIYGDFNMTGIGVDMDKDGGYYITQIFAHE